MYYEDITKVIGNTPLVKLNRIGSHLPCNIFAKCEFFNPGGSIKDRIAIKMIEDAEKQGRIKPGATLIEPTSGNTGIGMALAGAVKGYNIIITMPEKMSREKQVVLEALGAKIIRTPTEAAFDAPESHIGVANRMQKELPNAHILDQYANPANPMAHYENTAQELLDAFEGQGLDMVVMGAGTGGTITGISKKIKERYPNCVIVGCDPVGSILAGGSDVGNYKVEGIGYDFIPEVLDQKVVDTWVKTNDSQSFLLARRLIREEGLLCGGSAGSALYGALQEATKLKPNQNCVVLLPDGVRNYLTKFVDDKWMMDNRFSTSEKLFGNVEKIIESMESKPLTCIETSANAQDAIHLMKENGFSQLPVVDNHQLVGILSEKCLLESMLTGEAKKETVVGALMDRNAPSVDAHTPLTALQELLMHSGCVIVVDKEQRPLQILTKIDLVDWVSK